MGLATVLTEAVGYLQVTYPTLVSKFGGELKAEHDVPPRIIWVPTADAYGPAKLKNVEPRPIRTRLAGCTAFIWGADVATTETLVNDTIAALHKTAYGNYEIRSGQWLDAAKVQKGRAYMLEFTIEIPITLAPTTVTTLNDLTQNVGMIFPSGGGLADALAFALGEFSEESGEPGI